MSSSSFDLQTEIEKDNPNLLEDMVQVSSSEVEHSKDILSEMFDNLLQTTNFKPDPVNADSTHVEQSMKEAELEGLKDITAMLPTSSDNLYTQSVYSNVLQVQYASDDVRSFYEKHVDNYQTDSGWDLHFTNDVTIQPGETKTLDFGISVACYNNDGEPTALWLVPRSSIVKTPLRMANSIGLIDSSYRGSLKAVVDNIKSVPYTIKKGERLFQVAAPTLNVMEWQPVDKLSETDRGKNGFGSTGK